jgi:hypothetical protein
MLQSQRSFYDGVSREAFMKRFSRNWIVHRSKHYIPPLALGRCPPITPALFPMALPELNRFQRS